MFSYSNTPGVVMMGVGIVSTLVLKSLVAEANTSSPCLISYRSDSDEFPLPVPASIYRNDCADGFYGANKVIPKQMDFPEDRCSQPVGISVNEREPCASGLLDKESSLENLVEGSDSMQDMAFHHSEGRDERVFDLPARDSDDPCNFINEPSDPAAGDTYLIVEPPEESESGNNTSKTATLSSFTGPFLAPLSGDDSTSQSVTWTEGFFVREPFDHESEENADKKKRKSKSKNQKC